MRAVWIAAPLLGLAACVGALAWSAPEHEGRDDIYRQLDLFADVLARVEQDYVTEIDEKKAIESAIQGMLASLDPHSGYMDAAEYLDMQVTTRLLAYSTAHSDILNLKRQVMNAAPAGWEEARPETAVLVSAVQADLHFLRSPFRSSAGRRPRLCREGTDRC